MESPSTNTPENGRESWKAALVAILPLVAYACVYAIDGAVRRLAGAGLLGFLMGPLWVDALRIAAIPIVFYLVLLGGLLVAWQKGFPRWSYSYLGWLLLFLIASLGSIGQDGYYVWRIWGPLLVTLLLAIVLRPSLEPLRSLARGWKQDWTLSLLAGLSILPFLNGFDEMPGPIWARSVWLAVCTAVMVLGVLAYMRLPHRGSRAAALLSCAILSVALGMAVRAYYWNGLSDSLLLWSMWFAVLMLPALLSAVLNRLRPSSPVAAQIDPGARAKKSPIYLLVLLVWALLTWTVALMFWGVADLTSTLAFAGFLLLPLLVLAATRAHYAVWMCVAVLILVVLFLPASLLARIFAPNQALPLDSVAFKLYLILSFALIVAALLLQAGLTLFREQRAGGAVATEGAPAQHKRAGWAAVTALALSVLLLAKTLHSFYWFMAWDTTGDGLGPLWLAFPILAVICSSGVLAIVLPGRSKWAGLLYLLLIPALIGVYTPAMQVKHFELTEARAQQIGRALDTYCARQGHYPRDLRQLTPGTTLSVPEPFIVYGQDWCYDAGDSYYRLGAVYHEHWSSPNISGQLYSAKGDVPDLPPLCDAELTTLREYESIFR